MFLGKKISLALARINDWLNKYVPVEEVTASTGSS